MLVCYLDDSGKDPQNSVTTLAGYIARDEQWKTFETEVERWFAEFGVGLLHAKDLHNTDGEFKGWTVLRKQSFVARLGQTMSHHLMMGLSMSAHKETYEVRASESGRKRTVRPYTFCFNVIVDWIMRDIRLGGWSNSEGVAFILEQGHDNNAEVEVEFAAIREIHSDIAHLLHLIKFVPKTDSRAIQMADLIAFYSRRDSAAMLKAYESGRSEYQTDVMIRIITEGLPHRGFVATDYDQEGGPSWRPPLR
jgi:Protein of unknown function (DUF3800)